MTRSLLAVIGFVALLITAGCLGAAPAATTDVAPTSSSPGTVGVSSSGSVTIEPDLAVVSLAVEATADSADVARSQVADDVTAVRAAIRELGISDENVTTAYFSIQREYDYTDERRELVGYRAVHALTVEAAVDQAGVVIDAAVRAGAVRVNGVQFTLSDESRQSAREDALAAAMSNAAADAGAIADAGEFNLNGIQSVSTGSPVVSPFDGRIAFAEDGSSSTTIESGPVTVSAHVSVVYAIA